MLCLKKTCNFATGVKSRKLAEETSKDEKEIITKSVALSESMKCASKFH